MTRNLVALEMPENWSREEVEAAVSDYFDMLALELRGVAFNKAEHNRNLQKVLQARPRGSIERKHQNISAILLELGYPYVNGYKPLGNYQSLLRQVVEERLNKAEALNAAVADVVEQAVAKPPAVADLLAIVAPPPKWEANRWGLKHSTLPRAQSTRKNYLEIEARNRSLGCAGEEFVVCFEHERLRRCGRSDLAGDVEHVAKTEGDHLGFDVRSFESDGRLRLIEVKTTSFGPSTPFFASRNEVRVSGEREAQYHLYRLFNFVKDPRLYILPGALNRTCRLEPVQFSATPL